MKFWKLTGLSLLACAFGVYFALYGLSLPGKNSAGAEEIQGFFWPHQKQLDEFGLVDHHGQDFNLSSLQGHWNLIFFGYTYCPDICPITMSSLREMSGLLEQKSPNKAVRVVFVSVDGERDHPAHLANYIRFYSDTFLAASGTTEQVNSLTDQLGVPYQIEKHEPGDKNYLVSHSGALFLITPNGKLAAIVHPPHEPDEIADRMARIREFMDS